MKRILNQLVIAGMKVNATTPIQVRKVRGELLKGYAYANSMTVRFSDDVLTLTYDINNYSTVYMEGKFTGKDSIVKFDWSSETNCFDVYSVARFSDYPIDPKFYQDLIDFDKTTDMYSGTIIDSINNMLNKLYTNDVLRINDKLDRNIIENLVTGYIDFSKAKYCIVLDNNNNTLLEINDIYDVKYFIGNIVDIISSSLDKGYSYKLSMNPITRILTIKSYIGSNSILKVTL